MKKILLLLLSCCLLSCQQNDRQNGLMDILHNAFELASAEFLLEKIVIANQSKKLLDLIPLDEVSFLARTEATVKTGIDFSKVQASDVKIVANSIELELPPIEVIDFSYPFDKVKLIEKYSHLHKFDNTLSVHDIDAILQQAQIQIMQSLNHLHIRELSERKVKSVVSNLLTLEGFKKISIHFKETDQSLMPLPGNQTNDPSPTKKQPLLKALKSEL